MKEKLNEGKRKKRKKNKGILNEESNELRKKKVQIKERSEQMKKICLVSLLNGVSTCMGYLMPMSFL